MKNFKTLLVSQFVIIGLLACSSPAEKVQDAEQDVIEANSALDEANEDYMLEIEKYRLETEAKIEANRKSIAEFNARKENEKTIAKAEYKAKIAALEAQNTDMKKRMDDYKAEGKSNWELFKTEFNHDMEELGKAFKDLTQNSNE